MLRLNLDQADLLDQLVVRRHAAAVGGVLTQAWPQVTKRLGDRWPAFVEAALEQGRLHGIADPQDLARYASLWCIWGPAFDAKPGFAWAAEILADARRTAALKVHQLVHRTRIELGRLPTAAAGAPPVLTTAQFDLSLDQVERQVGALAAARAVFPAMQVRTPIKACDVGSIDMMVAEVDNLQEYRHSQTGWQRAATPPLKLAPDRWTRAPEGSVALAVPSRALRAGAAARLNLKIQAEAICESRTHPEVVHVSAQGRLAWKGRDTARLSLALYAPPDPSPPALPGLAGEPPVDIQSVHVGSCGLRDAGGPFGELELALRVVSATQWLFEVRQASWPAMVWPEIERSVEAAVPASCSLQGDGTAREVTAWQRGWTALYGIFRDGMEKLFNAWVRAFDGQGTRLEVDASPLVGQAGITWGWRRTDAATVVLRTEGVLDFLACALDVTLVGELAHSGARARIRAVCKGRTELRMTVAQLGAIAAEGQDLKSAQRSWRYPFAFEVEPLASADLGSLHVASGVADAPTGALVGECGLRPRPDGSGFQWFFALRVEPVMVTLESVDPVLGTGRLVHQLLPAMTLVDWSSG